MLYVLLLVVTMLVVCSINAYVEVFQRVLVDSLFVVLHPLNLCWAKGLLFCSSSRPFEMLFFSLLFQTTLYRRSPNFSPQKVSMVTALPLGKLRNPLRFLYEILSSSYIFCSPFDNMQCWASFVVCCLYAMLLFFERFVFYLYEYCIVSMKWNSEWSDLSVKVNLHQCFKPSCGELTLKKWHSSVRNVDSYCVS